MFLINVQDIKKYWPSAFRDTPNDNLFFLWLPALSGTAPSSTQNNPGQRSALFHPGQRWVKEKCKYHLFIWIRMFWLQNHVTMFLYMSSIAPVHLQEFRNIGSFTGISLHTVGSFTGISLHWFIYRNKLSLCTIISRIPLHYSYFKE